MTEFRDQSKLEQVVRAIDPQSRLLRAWELKGGVSAQVTALEVQLPDGTTRKLIVRQHGEADLRANPRVAADEFRLLRILQSAGLATPAPCHFDESGEILATPYVVVEYIEGEPEFAPDDLRGLILQLATHLSRIHDLNPSNQDLSFLPEQEQRVAARLGTRATVRAESSDEARIREALEAVWPLPQRNGSVLLHGDYWPGNVLWRDGQLVAVIDWEDAGLGDPLADVANARLELLWAFGSDAMRRFTHQYRSMRAVDLTNLPYWDLCAAVSAASKLSEWGVDEVTESRMRVELRWFVSQAIETLSVARHTRL